MSDRLTKGDTALIHLTDAAVDAILNGLRGTHREIGASMLNLEDRSDEYNAVAALIDDIERQQRNAQAEREKRKTQPTCEQRIDERLRDLSATLERFTCNPEDLTLADLRDIDLDEIADAIATEEAEGIAGDETQPDEDETPEAEAARVAKAREGLANDVPIRDFEYATFSSRQEDDIRERQQERASEYPLSIEVERLVKVTLSWGGPADYIEIPCDEDGASGRAIYKFQDWWDGARRVMSQDDTDKAFQLWGELAIECDGGR